MQLGFSCNFTGVPAPLAMHMAIHPDKSECAACMLPWHVNAGGIICLGRGAHVRAIIWHGGGYTPMCFDISRQLVIRLTVCVGGRGGRGGGGGQHDTV